MLTIEGIWRLWAKGTINWEKAVQLAGDLGFSESQLIKQGEKWDGR
ncbi:MAG: hypothetical protein Q7R95_11470 [bacterium]|nr:hypothetical protein [bacterium]